MGKIQIPPTIVLAKQIDTGTFSLFGELCQGRRGAFVQITDVFDAKRGGTIRIPIQKVADFNSLVRNLSSGAEAAKIVTGELKTVEGVVTLDPVRGPLFSITERWGDRAFTAQIPAGIAAEVEVLLSELAHAGKDLPVPPPEPPKEQRQQQPRHDNRERKPQMSGTGNLARPVNRDRKPQPQGGSGLERLEKKVDQVLAQQTIILALLGKPAADLMNAAIAAARNPGQVATKKALETLGVTLPELSNRDKVDDAPPQEDWEVEAAKERARTAVIEGTPHEAPVVPLPAPAIEVPAEALNPGNAEPLTGPVAVVPPAPEPAAPLVDPAPAAKIPAVCKCTLCDKEMPLAQLRKDGDALVCETCAPEAFAPAPAPAGEPVAA